MIKRLNVAVIGVLLLAFLSACIPGETVIQNGVPVVVTDNVTITNNVTSVNVTNTPLPIIVTATNGTAVGLNINSDGQLVVNNEVVLQEIAEHGQLENKLAKSFHVMGRRAGFNSTSILNDIKEFDATTVGLFPTLNTSQALQVVSSSASDTANGTGARSVEVIYIDASNNLITSANITLNGTTPVAAGFVANFIISMEVTSLGSSEVAQGDIVLRTVIGSTIQEQITAGGNRSLSSHFMIPTGYTGYLVSWEATSVSTDKVATSQDLRIRATVDDEGNLSSVYHFLDTVYLENGTASPQVNLPYIKLPALTKVKVSSISSGTATTVRVDCSYCLYIVQN